MCSHATLPPDNEEEFIVEAVEERKASECKLTCSDPDMLRAIPPLSPPLLFAFFLFFLSIFLCGAGCL